MTITKTEDNGRVVLKIDGWLDVQTTQELHNYLEQLPACRELIFDFAELEYISSAGIREVTAAYRRQKDADAVFQVIHVSPDVKDVFTMTGIDKKIDIQ